MNYFLALVLLFLNLEIMGIKDRFSQTFMFTRPSYNHLFAYEAFWENFNFHTGEPLTCVQTLGIYQQSASDSKKVKQYFLMKNRDELTVKGDERVDKFERDIRAEWLLLPGNFSGEFSVNPTQKRFSAVFIGRKDFPGIIDWKFLDNFWIGFMIPIESVRNELNPTQSQVQTATTNPPTILASLNRADVIYNKLLGCSSTAGFTELRVLLGAKFDTANDLKIATQSGFSFPLGNKYDSCQFFEAIRGFNGHLCWETIVNTQIKLNCDDSCRVYFYGDFSTFFMFANNQYRTFDLVDKPYSRYLLLNSLQGLTNVPAINVLTKKVRVSAHNIAELSAGIEFRYKNVEAKIGYGFWGKGTEKLELREQSNWESNFGIAAAPGNFTPEGLPATASDSTIASLAPVDKDKDGNNTFKVIEVQDLDFDSAAARGTITNSIEGAIGWVHETEQVDGFVGVGGFVELPSNNAALKNWGAFLKFGGSL